MGWDELNSDWNAELDMSNVAGDVSLEELPKLLREELESVADQLELEWACVQGGRASADVSITVSDVKRTDTHITATVMALFDEETSFSCPNQTMSTPTRADFSLSINRATGIGVVEGTGAASEDDGDDDIDDEHDVGDLPDDWDKGAVEF